MKHSLRKMMHLGLTNQELATVLEVLEAILDVDKAVVFGSRAKGNYKAGSDVDLAVWGDTDVVSAVRDRLNEETVLPYFFDVIAYESINNDELMKHIMRKGIVIFERTRTEELGTKNKELGTKT